MARVTNHSSDVESGDGLIKVQRRRRWTFMEKLRVAQEVSAPGISVSSVARKYGLAPSQLFRWRKVIIDGSLNALPLDQGSLAPEEFRDLQHRVRELERLLGKVTLENQILREALSGQMSKRQSSSRVHP